MKTEERNTQKPKEIERVHHPLMMTQGEANEAKRRKANQIEPTEVE